MRTSGYVVRVRFAGQVPAHLQQLAVEQGVYLGRDGRWASLEKALKFESFQAGEHALHEKWNTLRLSGDRSTILTIAKIN